MNEQSDNKNLTCPECGNGLKQVYAEANYGRILLLDQCDVCGGIWFDTWELYYLKDAEAKRLDAVNINSLLAGTPMQKGLSLCPRRCGAALEPFQDPNLPADSRINRCARCNGLWLNRGELVKYEEHKNKLKSRLEQTHSASKGAEAVFAVDSQKAKWETASRLGAALRTRPDNVDAAPIEDTNWDKAELSKDALFLILQILFKIVFKI
ncbi:MAG: zf-TFIIB domain-containing protein [Deltaproteobacteria bacterium]|nr:zf-TFIIB domain-containing protein [Deltaproteobacteria bacterium]